MYTVKIWVTVKGQGIADEIEVTSERSLRGAKSAASRFVNKNYFESDIISRKWGFETSYRADLEVRIKNPWN